jgi:hypothetical protein
MDALEQSITEALATSGLVDLASQRAMRGMG